MSKKIKSEPLPAGTRGGATRSIVGFDHLDYQRRFMANPSPNQPVNDAVGEGVAVDAAAVAQGQHYWRVIGIHHLEPVENTGKHNIFVDVLDESGQRVRNAQLQLEWGWDGQQANQASPPKQFDKPDNEPGTNLDLGPAAYWIRIGGDGLPGDVAKNFHTKHPDEPGPNGEKWNSIGHHSFYVVFQKTQKGSATPQVGQDGQTDNQTGTGQTGIPTGAGQDGQTQIFIPIAPVDGAMTARDKVGMDANAPINEATGQIMPQVADPNIIAGTGVGWVRLNFIVGQQWSGPQDQKRVDGLTWQETYSQLIRGFRNRGLKIYALISSQAVHEQLGDDLRHEPPAGGDANHWWIDRYVDNFVAILRQFKDDIAVVESFNEPDDWHGGGSNWVHPGWFAVILQRLYDAVRSDPTFSNIPLVSGPLQGLGHNNNGAASYLDRTYQAGKARYGWGSPGHPVPFDGVGYHLYVEEGFNPDQQAQDAAIRATYKHYLDGMRAVIQRHEGKLKQLYISEVGWFTNGDNQAAREAFQAANLKLGLNLLLNDPSVALTFVFCTQDFESATNDKYYGLYRVGGLGPEHCKPVHGALQAVCAQPLVGTTAGTGDSVHGAFIPHEPQPLQSDAKYVRDLIADWSSIGAGASFANTWTLRNSGATTWTADYKLVLIGGAAMGAASPIPIHACAPGQEIDVRANFVAPLEPGQHECYWKLSTPDGQLFGERVWVKISVPATRTAVEIAPLDEMFPATRSGSRRAQAATRSPQPLQPEQMGGQTLKEYDPDLYAAWSEHVKQGFQNNTTMFNRVLEGFMNPYYTAIWMYRILFGVGLLAFVAAVVLAMIAPTTERAIGTAALFGGLGVVAFLSYFLSRPLQALEENLQFITWLGIVYNTYWSRLTYAMDHETFHQQVEDANNDAINSIKEMLDKHASHSKNRPGLR